MSHSTSAVDTGIVSDSAIHAGEPIVAGTATTVRAIAELWNQGISPDEIPVHLPHLSLAQVFEALRHYVNHRSEIDQYIAANHIPDQWCGKQFDPSTATKK